MRFVLYLADMRKTVKKGGRGRKVAFFVITAVVSVIPAVLTSQFGFGISPILTGSMKPIANPGDVFVTRLVSASTLQVGDIIAVNNQITGTYYSHRINEIREQNGAIRIITKGDANSDADLEPFIISPSGQVSKEIALIPYVGRPMVYMSTVQGRQAAASFLVVANILGLFAFLFRKKIIESRTPEKVYKELYNEERQNNKQYRDLIESLGEALAIEKEANKKVGTDA